MMQDNMLSTNRLPPQSLDAERSVLGASMLSIECYDKARSILAPEDFYRTEHQIIFGLMGRIDGAVDLLSLCELAKEDAVLDKLGGPAYLSQISDEVIPSKDFTARAAGFVRENAKRREFIGKAAGMIDQCYNRSEFKDMVVSLEKEAFSLSRKIGSSAQAKSIGAIGKGVLDKIMRVANGEHPPGLDTGYDGIDNMSSGFQGGDLIIVAGRPSMGKTALAMNIAGKVGDRKIPVGVFSLEMNNESLGMRMLSGISKINGMALKTGFIRENQWGALAKATGYMENMPIYVDDTPALHIADIRSRARMMHRRHGIELIVLDYLQLARGDGDSREQVISNITSGLKAMAKELNIPVVALSQLNRGLENRPDKRPKLSDLRESGAIEQDADVIIFVYRDEVYNTAEDNPNRGIAELIFGKQRNGPTGTVRMAWLQDITTFEDLEVEHKPS